MPDADTVSQVPAENGAPPSDEQAPAQAATSATPDAAEPATSATPEAVEPATPEAFGSVAAAQADSDVSADGESAGDPAAVGEGAAEPSENSGAQASGPQGDGTGAKKKRRRRRKKKPAEPGQAVGTATESGTAKAAAPAPFAAVLKQAAHGHHAFSAGEVVAGRVLAVTEEGVIRVDLFGKAVAALDAREPSDIVPEPEAKPEASPGEGAATNSADSGPEASPAATAPAGAVTVGPTAASADETQDVEASADVAVPDEDGQEAAASETVAGQASPAEEAPADVPEAEVSAEGSEPAESDEDASQAGASVEPASDEPPPADPDEDLGEPMTATVGGILRGRVASVSESGHVAIVNRYIDRPAAKKLLRLASASKERVTGFVFGYNRGGFDVLVKGIRVFCPASGLALETISDPDAYLGRRYEFLVPQRKGKGGSIVVSRRSILEREQKKARKARLKTLNVGDVVTGTVTQVREFGVLVDIGEGLEGLVHQSELSWKRGVRPADLVTPKQTVEVKVLRIGEDAPEAARGKSDGRGGAEDKKAEATAPKKKRDRQTRIGLSVKALLPDPWDAHEEALKIGVPRKGRVVRTAEFGAFIELVEGIEGLLHISELGKNIAHANQVLKEDEVLDIVIDRVDRGQRRIGLSRLTAAEVKALEDGTLKLEERPRSLKPGSHLKVVIERVEHAGLTVTVEGRVGKKARGFIPNRDLGSFGSGEKRRRLTAGFTLEAKLVGTDRDGGLKLSITGRENDEERKAVREYRKETAQQGLGTFGDLLKAKMGDLPSRDGG